MTISRRIGLVSAISISLFFVVVFTIISTTARTRTVNQTHAYLSEKARSYMNQLEIDLTKPIQMLHSIDAIFNGQFFSSYKQTHDVFRNFSKALPESSGFIGATSDGTYYDGVDWVPPEGWVATERPWYKAAESKPNQIVFTEVYIDSQLNIPVVSIAKALTNISGNVYAVIAVDFPLKSITDLVSEINTNSSEMAFIINSEGYFIAHQTFNAEETIYSVEDGKWSIIDSLVNGNEKFVESKYNGKPYHFVSVPFKIIDWYFILGEKSSSVYAFSNSILRLFIVSFALIFAFLFIMLGATLTRSLRPLKRVADLLGEIAEGDADLSQRIKVKAYGEVTDVVQGFNKFGEKLENIVTNIKRANDSLRVDNEEMQFHIQGEAESIKKIVNSITTVGNQINEQSTAVSDTVNTMQEITDNIGELDGMIESQSHSVSEASSTVEELIVTIRNINNSIDKLADSFERIALQSKDGSEKQALINSQIIQIESQSEMLQEANAAISAVAEQTNLLAMNAAIESAHAGDAGKGFAVVADEIRKLSETSTEQSKTIGEQLSNVKKAIQVMVGSVGDASESFEMLSKEILDTDDLVNEIKVALEEQNISSRQITSSLATMRDNTSKVKQTSKKMASDSQAIFSEITSLRSTTKKMLVAVQLMSQEVQDINRKQKSLLSSSEKMKEQVEQIGNRIDLFK